jgi:hypothetical protein
VPIAEARKRELPYSIQFKVILLFLLAGRIRLVAGTALDGLVAAAIRRLVRALSVLSEDVFVRRQDLPNQPDLIGKRAVKAFNVLPPMSSTVLESFALKARVSSCRNCGSVHWAEASRRFHSRIWPTAAW